MKKVLFTILVVALAWCAGTAVASAQSASQDLTINATVAARVTLVLSAASVNFPDADPDTTNPIVSADVITITARARVASGTTLNLTCIADGPLSDGTSTIPIANVSWAGAGAVGYNATGTMSSTDAQPVGNWTGPGQRIGTQTYSLANLWSYVPSVGGGYTATVTYTLSGV